MALPKLFQRIFWHNNTTPALNEDNLNAMSKAIDDIDNRVIEREGTIMESVANAHTYMITAQASANSAAISAASAGQDAVTARTSAESAAQDAADAKQYRDDAEAYSSATVFNVDFETGQLMYVNEAAFNFEIDTENGDLMWEVVR